MDEAAGGADEDLGIDPPNTEPGSAPWTLVAHNRNVLKGWEWLCRNTPELRWASPEYDSNAAQGLVVKDLFRRRFIVVHADHVAGDVGGVFSV